MRHLPRSWTSPVLWCILVLLCGLDSPTLAATRNVVNFGATGHGTSDDTSAIKSAIAALVPGDTLLFPCGTYLTTSQLNINVSNVTVDGSSCAVIHDTVSGNSIIMVIGQPNQASFGPAVALSTTVTELSTSFTTVSSLGVSAGDYIYIHQGGIECAGCSNWQDPTQCDTTGCRGEILQVQSVSGNTVTVTTALHDTYNPSVNAAVVQKMLNPLTGMTFKNITFDGSGTIYYGLQINGIVNSTVTGVTSKNIVGAAIASNGDFNVAWSNISISAAGSENCGAAASFAKQGNLSITGMTLSNLNPGQTSGFTGCLGDGAFGFALDESTNSTVTNVSIDGSGSYGRPFKTTTSRWNTFNSLTAKNNAWTTNGLTLNYYSSHNTFNNCIVTNNGVGTSPGQGQAGINLFGNFNQYNTFSNCTVSGNANVQIYDSLWYGTSPPPATDDHNSFIGTTVGGPGIGMLIGSSNACINNNAFAGGSGLSAGISVQNSTDTGSGNVLNGYSSNLTAGTCQVQASGGAPPAPTGLVAVVQ